MGSFVEYGPGRRDRGAPAGSVAILWPDLNRTHGPPNGPSSAGTGTHPTGTYFGAERSALRRCCHYELHRARPVTQGALSGPSGKKDRLFELIERMAAAHPCSSPRAAGPDGPGDTDYPRSSLAARTPAHFKLWGWLLCSGAGAADRDRSRGRLALRAIAVIAGGASDLIVRRPEDASNRAWGGPAIDRRLAWLGERPHPDDRRADPRCKEPNGGGRHRRLADEAEAVRVTNAAVDQRLLGYFQGATTPRGEAGDQNTVLRTNDSRSVPGAPYFGRSHLSRTLADDGFGDVSFASGFAPRMVTAPVAPYRGPEPSASSPTNNTGDGRPRISRAAALRQRPGAVSYKLCDGPFRPADRVRLSTAPGYHWSAPKRP